MLKFAPDSPITEIWRAANIHVYHVKQTVVCFHKTFPPLGFHVGHTLTPSPFDGPSREILPESSHACFPLHQTSNGTWADKKFNEDPP